MTTGAKVGPYTIVAPLGAGGMGEVYRAHDTRLGRDVALKVLPEAFARDAERMARFEREAHLLASLNHPHIAAIYGLEEADGRRYLVLELVEGETLAERVARGPLPLEDALSVCGQIAEALEAAHEKGIIHRDLKPANVKVTPQGKVKVLDFGLAKAFEGEAAQEDISKSPTLTSPATQLGALLGTAAYMSPEQARGRAVDRRADSWAFGCVLYELLSGRQAFSGETVSDTIASVLKTEADWSALPAATPPSVRRLLRRCLEKDPKRRLRDIADAWLQMEEALREPVATVTATPVALPAGPRWQQLLPWALAGVLLVVSLFASWQWWERGNPSRGVTRFAVTPPSEHLVIAARPAVALSPDGRRFVYVADHEGVTRLYLRNLDQLEATPMPGTENASGPFFSPDGQWIGFFAAAKLKKVAVQGGGSVALCEAPDPRGATWMPDDTIIFSPGFTTGLFRVPANGGVPQPLTTPDASHDERTHRWPEALPGGKAVLFVIGEVNSPDYYLDAQIAVQLLETGERKLLPIQGTFPRYSSTGHLLYATAAGLFAVQFDLSRLETTATPAPVLEAVGVTTDTGAGHYGISPTGSFVYVPGSGFGENTLVWVDRKGAVQPLAAPPRPYEQPHLSPEGKRVAVVVGAGEVAGTANIWVLDIARGTLTRLTFEGTDRSVLWSPDGERITFNSERNGKTGIYWKPADGSGSEEALIPPGLTAIPESWSPDGKFLAISQVEGQNLGDLWILPLEGERKPKPFLQTRFDEWGAQFSPDGRWLAYVSTESGREEVYVQPFPGPGGKWQVSTDGGLFPLWSRSGRELFYLNRSNRLISVPVATQPSFAPGTPQGLFDAPPAFTRALANGVYSPAPDGQRFLFAKAQGETTFSQMVVVLNWDDELQRQLSSGKR
ncbi:MAG: protein kinase domain-containing protein [Candidatus Acidiferrales bacterium]